MYKQSPPVIPKYAIPLSFRRFVILLVPLTLKSFILLHLSHYCLHKFYYHVTVVYLSPPAFILKVHINILKSFANL